MGASTSRARLLLWASILLGVALHLPALGWDLYADDYGQQAVLDGRVEHPTMKPWNLYDFGYKPQPGEVSHEKGAFPWWTDDDWKGRFFRPLTSVLLWAEHALFGRVTIGYQLMALGWFALLLWLVHRLFRAYGLSERAALIASFLFATHASSFVVVGWRANRNSLYALICTVMALLLLKQRGLAPALALGAVACLCKESGIAVFALIAAVMLVASRCGFSDWPPGRRRRAFLASVVCAGGYLGFLRGADYGTRTLFYATPWDQPLAWLGRLGEHLSVDFLALLFPQMADNVFLFPHLLLPCLAASAAVILPLAWLIVRVLRGRPGVVFFALWTGVLLLPQVGAPLSGRLLMGAAIGSSALLALLAEVAFFERRGALRLVGYGVILAAVGGAVVLVGGGTFFGEVVRFSRDVYGKAAVGPPGPERREVFVLNYPTVFTGLSGLALWEDARDERDRTRVWPLQLGRAGLRVTRLAERTLELESRDTPLLTHPVERVFLSQPLAGAGRVWRTALFEVRGVAAEGHGLRRVRIELPERADHPSYSFLAWRDGALRPVTLPAVGATIELPRAEPPSIFYP